MAKTPGNLDGVQSSPIVATRDRVKNLGREKMVVLSGFLGTPLVGPGGKLIVGREPEGKPKWRLYRTLAMDEYIEFDESDVVHYENVSKVGEAPGSAPRADERVLIWLRPSAPVTPIKSFLAGEIADMYLPETDILANMVDVAAGQVRFITRAGGTEAPPCKT